MNTAQRQEWEQVRSKGHRRFILVSFLRWGVPMCAAQFLGALLYGTIKGEPFTLFSIFPWPTINATFQALFWICGFGYLMGEGLWQKHERDYRGSDDVANERSGVDAGWQVCLRIWHLRPGATHRGCSPTHA
jgi:hypothetical protein